MSMEPAPVTFAELVRRSAQIVDPDDQDAIIGDFERAFEDADEPVTALDDLDNRLATVLARLDPATNNGSLAMAGALTTYLSYRRDELGAEPSELLRLAARAEWKGDPPDTVRDYLSARGIEV